MRKLIYVALCSAVFLAGCDWSWSQFFQVFQGTTWW